MLRWVIRLVWIVSFFYVLRTAVIWIQNADLILHCRSRVLKVFVPLWTVVMVLLLIMSRDQLITGVVDRYRNSIILILNSIWLFELMDGELAKIEDNV